MKLELNWRTQRPQFSIAVLKHLHAEKQQVSSREGQSNPRDNRYWELQDAALAPPAQASSGSKVGSCWRQDVTQEAERSPFALRLAVHALPMIDLKQRIEQRREHRGVVKVPLPSENGQGIVTDVPAGRTKSDWPLSSSLLTESLHAQNFCFFCLGIQQPKSLRMTQAVICNLETCCEDVLYIRDVISLVKVLADHKQRRFDTVRLQESAEILHAHTEFGIGVSTGSLKTVTFVDGRQGIYVTGNRTVKFMRSQ